MNCPRCEKEGLISCACVCEPTKYEAYLELVQPDVFDLINQPMSARLAAGQELLMSTTRG